MSMLFMEMQMDNSTCLYSVKIIRLWVSPLLVVLKKIPQKQFMPVFKLLRKEILSQDFLSWMEEIYWFCVLSPLFCRFGWGAFTMDSVYKKIHWFW